MSSFTDILAEVQAMHDKKSKDYGRAVDPYANVRASDAFGIPGWVGSLIRQNDKMRRLQKFAQDGYLANESVEDSLLDNIVYGIIALALYREERDATEKGQVPENNLSEHQDGNQGRQAATTSDCDCIGCCW